MSFQWEIFCGLRSLTLTWQWLQWLDPMKGRFPVVRYSCSLGSYPNVMLFSPTFQNSQNCFGQHLHVPRFHGWNANVILVYIKVFPYFCYTFPIQPTGSQTARDYKLEKINRPYFWFMNVDITHYIHIIYILYTYYLHIIYILYTYYLHT